MRAKHTHNDFLCKRGIPIACLTAILAYVGHSGTAFAQIAEATQVFDEGTRYLEDGYFREAVAAYNVAERLGLGSGALFYNRGVAHYRLEGIGQAVRYFERASRLLPDDPWIQHNLDIVAGRIIDRFSELPTPVWKRLQQRLISHLSVQALINVGLGLYFLFITLLIMKVRGSGQGRWFRRARAALAVIALSFLLVGFSSSIWPAYPTQAVILAREVSIHERPDADAAVTLIVHEGLVVSTVAWGEDWVLIQLPNGARGWVTAEGLAEI